VDISYLGDSMAERYCNPKETICLLIYKEPKNVNYICQMLYGKKRNSKVSLWLSQLIEKEWIKEATKVKGDRRHKNYQATPKCLIDSIKESKIKLDVKDQKVLYNYFSSDKFRWWTGIFFTDMQPWYTQRWFSLIKDRICAKATLFSYIKHHGLFETYEQINDIHRFNDDSEIKCFTNDSLCAKLSKLNPSLNLFLQTGFWQIQNIIIQKNSDSK